MAENRLEVGVCYNDGLFTSDGRYTLVSIEGSNTDPAHFMWLTVAEGERHRGTAGKGVILDGEDRASIGVRIRDDHTRIEWLEMKRFRRWYGAAAVSVPDARDVLLGQLLIHDFYTPQFMTFGIKGSLRSDFTVRNAVIYDGDTAGILNWLGSTATVENCTIYGMQRWGIYGGYVGKGLLTVINTISMGNPGGDFSIADALQTHNLSSDDTASGPGSLTDMEASSQFVSLVPGFEDFHLTEEADAIDAGHDLSMAFTADIDGETRAVGEAWDIGADEYTPPDRIPPLIVITSPQDGSEIDTVTPEIAISFTDDDSGIDPASFRAEINDVDSTSLFALTETGARYQVTTPLPIGENTIEASISDDAGNTASAASAFTVVIFHATLNASLTKGGIPLEVQFSATVSGGTPPYSYSWDLDGDGGVDDTRASLSHIYQQQGTYEVSLSVSDAAGNTASDAVTIYALSAPTVVAAADPTEGDAALEVSFSATVSDPDGTVIRYEWDFDGDGTYDHSDSITANTTHTYTTAGLYHAAIRVTDNDGLTGADKVTITVGRPPSASVGASPTTGPAPLEVTFTGTGADPDGTISLHEWDFDGDGTYDWSDSATGNTTHTYTTSGVFNATLRVTDNDGLIATGSLRISVSGPPTAQPGAYPTSGNAPLTVTFFSDGEDVDGSIRYFDWDFDGDIVYDLHLLASMNATHTYNQAGVHNATLKVTDDDGLTGIASITITVTEPNPEGYPTAIANANPTNGGAPLAVTLMGSGTDPDGAISGYEWDFDGDGVYDWAELAEPGGPIGLLISVSRLNKPVFADIDQDGDFDLFVGEYDGTIDPLWTLMGLLTASDGTTIDIGASSSPVFVDIDNDEDFDLFVGESDGVIYFYRNNGTSDSPLWASMGPLTDSEQSTIDVGSYSDPAFMDIDSDGDFDLFVGESGGGINFYRNDGTSASSVWTQVGLLIDSDGTPIDVGSYSSPIFGDIDGDEDFDLFVGESGGGIYFYQNNDTSDESSWTSMGLLADSEGTQLDAGLYSGPDFVDIDNDRDLDLFVGEQGGRLYFYRNEGDASSPLWNLVSQKYNYIGVDSASSPALVDIDSDDDFDLFIGESGGMLYFYRNDGTRSLPLWTSVGFLTDSNGDTLDAGSNSSPAFADIDSDGDFDLFAGDYTGRIYYYQNDGTSDSPLWTPVGFIADSTGKTIDVTYLSSPLLADIDQDGDLDLFFGHDNGWIYHYRNDGTSDSPVWTPAGLLTDSEGTTIDVGSYSDPAFADIDEDGDLDLFIGEYTGRVYHYINEGTLSSSSWEFVSSSYNGINLQSRSTLAFVDVDSDGDDDLLVGNGYGSIYLYPTFGHVLHLYESPGTYQAILRVTDDDGFSDSDAVGIDVYESGTPTAFASADPTAGEVPLAVNYTGTGTDPDGSITLYEWDFDGDGTYDWSSPTAGSTSHTYEKLGTYQATFRVTDNDGKSATDAVTIKASLGISTSRTDWFDPWAGQTGGIASTLTDDAVVTIRIVDENGNVVRTLIDSLSRTVGSYTDAWDGKDDAGNTVPDGLYCFVIEYTVNGETYTYDLRETAQFTEYLPPRSWPSTFNPYDDDFVEVTYALAKPAEVSLYFWTRGPGTGEKSIIHVRTLFVRERRGAGSHTEIWDGVDDKGAVVDAGKVYPVTLKAFELPDNAMIVAGDRPKITDASAEPNYLSPAYNPYGSQSAGYTIVSFHLSKPANLEAKVANADGVVIRKIDKTDLPSGVNSLIWDGKDFDGNLVNQGSYTIELTAIDEKGNRSLPRCAAAVVYY